MSKKNTLLTAALAAIAGAAGVAAMTSDAHAQATTSWSGAPRTNEEDRQFKVNGRIQYDMFSVNQDFSDPAAADNDYSGSFARRAFIGVEGRFTQNWRYNVKFDLAPSDANANCTALPCNTGNGNEVRLDDAYLEYAGDDYSIVIGQNNAVSHLEDRTSSNYTPFNERSMIDQAYGFGKIFGIGAVWSGGNWSLGGAWQADSLNNAQTINANEPNAFVVRGTWAPIYERTPDGITLLHLGVNVRHRDGGTGTVAYSARPAQNSATGLGSTISSSGTFKADDLIGVELAGQWNAFGATVEYMQLEAERSGAGDDAETNGGYVDLFWSPTGEARNYTAADGSWGRITPRRTLGSDGGIGAVWLSARYEWLDMSDDAFGTGASNRGEQTGYNLGITWAPIGYVRFQLNHGSYELDREGTVNDQEIESTTLRTQFDW